jgi:hypothetical protein
MSEIEKETNDDIKNWYVYDSYQVAIDVYRHHTDAGYVYNPHISHVLEVDEDSNPSNPTKVISIVTDLWEPDLIESIKLTANSLDILFDSICDEVNVYDEEIEVLEVYSLNELMKKSVIISLKA